MPDSSKLGPMNCSSARRKPAGGLTCDRSLSAKVTLFPPSAALSVTR
jgi:hypothetical protein